MSIVEMKVPTIGESVTEVTLSQWLVSDGDFVNLDDPICEFESDKATLEFPAEAAGKVKFVAGEGDDLEIGALVAKIDTSVKAPAGGAKPAAPVVVEASKAEVEATPAPEPVAAKESYAKGHPSPAASKILAEKGISPAAVNGSGRDGRITKEDANAAKTASGSKPVATPTPLASAPAVAFSRNQHTKKMSRMRKTIAKRLVSA